VSVRFTNQELEMRRRAQTVLDDATAGDWHRKRAMGDLKRIEKAARARAAQREAQDANSTSAKRDIPPNGTTPEAWAEEQQRVKTFLDAIGNDAPKPAAPPSAQADAPAASVAPRAAMPQPEKFCERCQVSFEICHCDKPKPMRAELADIAARDARDEVESADDLTPCPLCLIPRGRCHHSGRRNPAADISFLHSQMF